MLRFSAALFAFAPFAGALVTAGCVATSKVSDDISTQSLAASNKSVVVMRLSGAGPQCQHVAVLLGVKQAEGFRGVRALTVASVRSVTEPPVAEAELEPGDYHLLAYKCFYKKNATVAVGDKSDTSGVYRSAFARFTLRPGEIVNVGYLHFNAHRVGLSAFGRPLRREIAVTDWPLADLDQFKAKRPAVYAQMVTRLMQITIEDEEPTVADCARLAVLKAERKVESLPPECVRPSRKPAKAARTPA